METIIRNITPKGMGEAMVDIEDFITLYNEEKVELLDIRVPAETNVWQLNFGLKIPANELPDRLDELPKDKVIVCVCPKSDRSIMVRTYLTSIGISSRYLRGGMLELMERLKGGKAKDINQY